MRAKVTSFDIAEKAGVSQSTVSRALSDSPLVSLETKARVHAAAKELNYKVDKNASNLRRQSSNTIALLLFEESSSGTDSINPFYLSMLGAITRACSNQGYDLLVSFQELGTDWFSEYEDAHKADGLILLGYGGYLDYQQKLVELENQGTHFVRWGDTSTTAPGITIGCDNFEGGRQISEHLLERGRKQIAFIGDISDDSPELKQRYLGYQKTLNDNGLHCAQSLQFNAEVTEHSGYLATKKLIASGQSFDAVFAACDYIALGAMRALQESGYTIPTDVSVAGFDDVAIAKHSRPALTTAIQDPNEAGKRMVKTLLKLIRNEPCQSHTLETRLAIRGSC
ncbi:LacI family DNA-binding transcriptional regulator [Paraferrimonas sp. SM1919]|uniref:LacI family DNA-binding transcriptional regulator n=1 Tax=Paraferrimonas sp. SM1919 TaxID=2662263 RepID=UPI0013D2BB75|nr:LacI family DNA-binding transcriptional regulator [Paraferrimonas sp. SM1919]